MDLQEFISVLNGSPLAEYSTYLSERRRPLIELVREDGPVRLHQSRICGAPDVPAGFQWPEHEGGAYRFLMQLNFGEMPKCLPEQPAGGLLTIFEKFDADGNMNWSASDYIVARFFSDNEILATAKPPDTSGVQEAIPLSFRSGFDIPLFDNLIPSTYEGSPIPKARWREYADVRNELHETPDFLFGYPTNRCLGYDPTPGPGWMQLVNLDTDEDLEWYFHDGSKLMIFIEADRLAKCDFGKLTTDAG